MSSFYGNDREERGGARWLIARNNGEEEIPAFAALHVVGVEVSENRTVLLVEKPGSESRAVVFNGPTPIRTGEVNHGLVTADLPAVARVAGTAAVGTQWGVIEDSFGLSEDVSEFVALGSPASDLGLIDRTPGGRARLGCVTEDWTPNDVVPVRLVNPVPGEGEDDVLVDALAPGTSGDDTMGLQVLLIPLAAVDAAAVGASYAIIPRECAPSCEEAGS